MRHWSDSVLAGRRSSAETVACDKSESACLAMQSGGAATKPTLVFPLAPLMGGALGAVPKACGQNKSLRSCSAARSSLEVFGDNEGRTIAAVTVAQDESGFVISNHFFSFRIELERAAHPVRGICQVNQPGGNVTLLNRRV